MLDRPMPAQLNYILDPDWRERLMVTTFNYRDVKEYTYIRAPDDPEDEAEHCLRMRRCGADALLYNVTTHVLQERLSAASAMQIMGWPSSGGVWMYRVPQSWYAGKSLEERFAGAPPYSQMGLDNPAVMLEKVNGDLRGCGGMDEFCEVLRGYGGVYFGDVRKCRAVVGLRLVDARGSGEFVKWVFERLGDEDTRLMSSTTRYIGTTKVWDPNGSKEFLEGEEDEEF
ncbi:hypothetical protein GLAREA_07953 [Glarea lozoyensis ATCC 20868]|uniref:Uncharacterized protein n=1 Tax=Glarea lozoyensis (strain ATCC 20868 / MF5171) TaxID=1116229 RepID=S3DBR7_GLAL2|nr:uncharacterized protein GLAREA_07953 [Glarea lozoyensis ATCC 20868]EPE24103.1 hypothetical protein GLAREA_07953 [Glarea lozoyensis ATCC 20868]